MEYVMLVLFLLSSIGYFSWMRRAFRLSFSSSVFFSTSAAIILMFIFGLLRIMTVGAWLIFAGGFIPAVLDVFSLKDRKIHKNWFARMKSHYWRNEYCIWSVAVVYALIIFLGYGLLGKTDIWRVWFDQFYYMALNDCWIDSGYKNYASGYSMIGNAFCYYMAVLLNNFGIQIYMFSYFVICIGLISPIFAFVNWRRIFLVETVALLILLSNYKMSHFFGMHVFWVFVFLFLLLRKIIVSFDRKKYFVNTIILFLCVIFTFLLINYPWNFLSYCLDSTLGIAFCGIVCCWIVDVCFTKRIKGNICFLALPLTVLTLLKPTGVIFSSCIAFAISIHLCCTAIVCWRKNGCGSRHPKLVFRPLVLLLIALLFSVLPFAVRQGWGFYAKYNHLRLQHTVNPNKIIDNMVQQLKTGLTKQEIDTWEKNMWNGFMLYDYSSGELSFSKSVVEQHLDKILGDLFYRNNWDHSRSLRNGKVPENQSFVFSIFVMQVVMAGIMIFYMKRRKIISICILCWSVFVWLFVFILQYYVTPMFTTVPGIFRYLWPGLLPVWACVVLLTVWLLKQHIRIGVFFAAVFLYLFIPLLFTKTHPDTEALFRNNSLGYVLLGQMNAGKFANAVFSEPYTSPCVTTFLSQRLGAVKRVGYPVQISNKLKGRMLLVVCDSFFSNTARLLKTYHFLPGFYLLSNDKTGNIDVKKLCDRPEEGVKLLNKVYSLKDPDCWSRPPIIERNIDGNFSHGNTLDGSKWVLAHDGRLNSPENYQLRWRSWGKRDLRVKTDKKSRLENWRYQYVFVEDKLKLSWIMDSPAQAGGYILLKKKNGKRYESVRNLLMKTDVVKVADGKWRFEGTLDLSEYKGLNFDYYMFSIILPACPEGLSISDIKMTQTVSGKLYFDPAYTVGKK